MGLKLVGMRRFEGQYGDACYTWIGLDNCIVVVFVQRGAVFVVLEG